MSVSCKGPITHSGTPVPFSRTTRRAASVPRSISPANGSSHHNPTLRIAVRSARRSRAGEPFRMETLHPAEIPHASRVFSFRATQNFHKARSFHVNRGR